MSGCVLEFNNERNLRGDVNIIDIDILSILIKVRELYDVSDYYNITYYHVLLSPAEQNVNTLQFVFVVFPRILPLYQASLFSHNLSSN